MLRYQEADWVLFGTGQALEICSLEDSGWCIRSTYLLPSLPILFNAIMIYCTDIGNTFLHFNSSLHKLGYYCNSVCYLHKALGCGTGVEVTVCGRSLEVKSIGTLPEQA